jgi:hypothetical protein
MLVLKHHLERLLMKEPRENIDSLRESYKKIEAKRNEHLKEGRTDMVISLDKVLQLIEDDIEEQEKDLTTNRDGATD